MESKKYSRNSKNGTSYDRDASVSRRRDGSFNQRQGGKRQFSSDIEWNSRGPRQRNLENIQDHEGRIWRDESRHFHQPPNFMLDPSISSMDIHADLDHYNVDQRQSRLTVEIGPSAQEFYRSPLDYPGADPNQSRYNMDEWVVGSSISPMGMASTNAGMNPYPYGVPSDPSMYGMMNGAMAPTELPHCILLPPPSDAEAPSRRDRPPGCRTVFVGGLPERVNEQIIKEMFSHCGEVSRITMSRKNFCHVRFDREETVEQALILSGYRLVVKYRNGGHGTSSRIHVDYAYARDDEKDYEGKMHALQREEHHRAPSPEHVLYYSDREAANLVESLRGRDTFEQGCKVLMTWLERGDCNKKNSGTFYSMIQSTYSHVKKLVAEKNIIEDELTVVQQKLHQQSTANAHQFKIVEKVLQNASSQKVWDHFTKPQRKHIEQWKELTNLAEQQNSEDLLEDRIEDEMEMSDSEDQKPPEEWTQAMVKLNENSIKEDKPKLVDEVEVLLNQLQAANFEMAESKKKISALNDAYQLMQLNYLDTKKKLEEATKDKMALGNVNSVTGAISVTEAEARLVSLIGTFLIVHPFGASIDYICSYLAKMDKNISSRDVENLLKKFNTVFKEESTGIGASLEKKWIFFGFNFYAVPNQNPFFKS